LGRCREFSQSNFTLLQIIETSDENQEKPQYGKILFRMVTNVENSQVIPPRIIPTFIKGFNIVANQVYLILIPFFVDLGLWLGPKLRIKELILPSINAVTDSMFKIASPELTETVKASFALWKQILDGFNLLTLIRTFPVGVPSLVTRNPSMVSPLSPGWIYEIPNAQIAISLVGGLLLVGFFLGVVYFELLARASTKEPGEFSWKALFEKYAQSILFFLTLVTAALLIAVPLLIMISVLTMVNPGIGQFVVWILLFVSVWIIMPLVFSVHGIFALNQKVVPSMLLSMRMVRFFLPGTGLFILSAVLINEGMNRLWVLPESNSWFLAVGLFGHAFFVTALLASTFVFFREGLNWMQVMIQRINQAKQQQENGGNPVEQQ
jgi:hypothetical protein